MKNGTQHAFTRYAFVMALACSALGLAFPAIVAALGIVPPAHAFSPAFLAMSLGAGLLVGGGGALLVHRIVGRSLSGLARSMHAVADSLTEAAYTGDRAAIDLATRTLASATGDPIGEAVDAFNALLHALERSRETDDQVRAFSGVVGESIGLRQLGVTAVEALLPLTEAHGAALTVLTDDGMEVVATAGEGSPPTMAAIISRNDLNSVSATTRVPYGEGIEGMLAPVFVRDEAVGMLLLEGTSWRPGAETRVGLFLPALGLGVAAALARERLERAAERDPLTGIRNRRAGSAALGHALDLARKGGGSVGVILVDLDHFKRVNDTYGHPVGDRVLIAAAGAMATVLRSDDVLARYGGEEFLVICPRADRAALAVVGERLRAAVAARPFVLEGMPVAITASVGGATLAEVLAGSAERLVAAADEALYVAKREGRNRVVLAAEGALESAA